MATLVKYGNVSPVSALHSEEGGPAVRQPMDVPGGADGLVTDSVLPSEWTLAESIASLAHAWEEAHSNDPPEWVESSDPELATKLAERFSSRDRRCAVGRPAGWRGHETDRVIADYDALELEAPVKPPRKPKPKSSTKRDAKPIGGGSVFDPSFELRLRSRYLERLEGERVRNLRVNTGASYQAGVMGDPASTGTGSYAPACYVGLAVNGTAPSATDTRTTWEQAGWELQASGGGLNRAAGAFTYNAGGPNYTITKTFTMNSNDGTSVTVRKIGILTAARGGGILAFETLAGAARTMIPGDQLSVTESITLV